MKAYKNINDNDNITSNNSSYRDTALLRKSAQFPSLFVCLSLKIRKLFSPKAKYFRLEIGRSRSEWEVLSKTS